MPDLLQLALSVRKFEPTGHLVRLSLSLMASLNGTCLGPLRWYVKCTGRPVSQESTLVGWQTLPGVAWCLVGQS